MATAQLEREKRFVPAVFGWSFLDLDDGARPGAAVDVEIGAAGGGLGSISERVPDEARQAVVREAAALRQRHDGRAR